MSIDRTALEYLVGLAPGTQIKLDDRTYSTRPVHLPPAEPVAAPLHLSSLGSLIDYIDWAQPHTQAGGQTIDAYALHVESPTRVQIVSHPLYRDRRREVLAEAICTSDEFPLGTYVSLESFLIMLQSRFVANDHRDLAIRLLSNVQAGMSVARSDDGLTQKVTVKAGVDLERIDLPNPCSLAPWRSFREIEQPTSRYLLRLRQKGDGEQVEAALFEADGGSWKIEACKRIAQWLTAASEQRSAKLSTSALREMKILY